MRIKKFKDINKNGVDDRLDRLTNICAVLLPFTTIDQLYIIYVKKQVEGVSAITWILYFILNFPLLIYAMKRKDTPMIVLNGLWLVVDSLVWVGVLIYS